MSDPKRIAGIVEVAYNGKIIKVTGNISYNFGKATRESLVGPDGVHGYKEMPQAPFIEGECRVVSGFSVEDFTSVTNATVTAKLATGKIAMVSDAWFEGEGTAGSEEGTLPFKFVGTSGKEIG